MIAKYLSAYTTALKGKPTSRRPFRKAFIDAFAGTGYRTARQQGRRRVGNEKLLFPDLAEPQAQELLAGSARLALQTEPRFDKYVFIESSAARCVDLEGLKSEFPDLAADIDVRHGEANAELRAMCSKNKDWSSRRAVLFLDPYGMQVEWKTIEAVAQTRAIDLWLLFPLGIGVNRLLKRSGEIPEEWREVLDTVLGTADWYEELYRVETTPTLFGDQRRVVKENMEKIGSYFNGRLQKVFAGVAERPGVLRNSVNNPLYLLCFATGNERGKRIALRLANHLLEELR